MTLKAQKATGGRIEDWYVAIDHMERLYLHSDGVVREGVYQNGEFSGLFPTKEAAEAAIEAYKNKDATK